MYQLGLFCKTILFTVYNIHSKHDISVMNIWKRMKCTRQHRVREKNTRPFKEVDTPFFHHTGMHRKHTHTVRNYEPCKTKMFPVDFSTRGEFMSFLTYCWACNVRFRSTWTSSNLKLGHLSRLTVYSMFHSVTFLESWQVLIDFVLLC